MPSKYVSDIQANRMGAGITLWKANSRGSALSIDVDDVPEMLRQLGFPKVLVDEATQWAEAVRRFNP